MVVVNENLSYKPPPFNGVGWQEINGSTAKAFLNQLEWVKDNSCEFLQNREIDVDGKSLNDQCAITFVYKGVVRDRTVGLILGPAKSPLRAFMVTDQDAYDRLLAMLQRNKGFVDDQLKDVGKVFSNNDANAVYAWTADYFGINKHVMKVAKTNAVSRVASKKAIAGTRAELVTEKEAIQLIKEIAKRYDLYNVEIIFGPFDGKTLGWCMCSEDSVTPFSLPVGLKMFFAKDILYKHTVLHECAHGIEFMRHGVSGHGKGFRTLFKLLLRQYMQVRAEGL